MQSHSIFTDDVDITSSNGCRWQPATTPHIAVDDLSFSPIAADEDLLSSSTPSLDQRPLDVNTLSRHRHPLPTTTSLFLSNLDVDTPSQSRQSSFDEFPISTKLSGWNPSLWSVETANSEALRRDALILQIQGVRECLFEFFCEMRASWDWEINGFRSGLSPLTFA